MGVGEDLSFNGLGGSDGSSAGAESMESEGYIVCDRDFNRVKVKSPQYVAIAHLRESFSARRLLKFWSLMKVMSFNLFS